MAKTTVVNIQPLNLKTAVITIEGITPLLSARFPEEAAENLRAKGEKKVKKTVTRDPEKEFQESLYIIDPSLPDGTPGKYGFPGGAFRKAMVSACRTVEGLTMTVARQMFQVLDDFVVLRFEKLSMRQDIARNNRTGAVLVTRAQFDGWSADLNIQYNADAISLEQIGYLLETAGFSVGVGAWRPECSGQFGMFRVARKK